MLRAKSSMSAAAGCCNFAALPTPMKALTAAEMREVDRLTIERHGISSWQLMETAGRRAADAVWRVVAGRENVRICVLCGKGNNGGDGFVVARILRDAELSPRVVLFGKPEEVQGDAAANLSKWLEHGGRLDAVLNEAEWRNLWPQLSNCNVFVDAMLGTGLKGPATGAIALAIEDINKFSMNATRPLPAFILAVDTPSGLPSEGEPAAGPVLAAHRTITFTAPKLGQLVSSASSACGALHVVPIGSPSSLIEETGEGSLRWAGPEEFAFLPLVRSADSHKGKFGHVLVVGGSTGKSGAAVLAGYASMCAGAGLTTIATPDVVQPIVAGAHPEYMTEALTSTSEGTIAYSNIASGLFEKILFGKTILAIGPGIGTELETQDVVRHLVQQVPHPIILDADGLNAFAGSLDELRDRKSEFLCVTPHPGEMARLFGISNAEVQSDRVKAATEAAKRANAYVILKGFHTILASPRGPLWINTSGSPALAKGGSGDVLTGVLAALTGQFGTEDWLRVLALGTFLHGTAADILSRDEEPSGILSQKVAATIPAAREWLLKEIQFGG
jgi:ADP-dependent NAD(P)H-hydrate dehydratase / NAD(P)H-hydrate epimerase